MHLNVKNDEAHKLATELARLTGESLTSAVTVALRERLARERRRRNTGDVAARLMKIGNRYAALPDTGRSPDEILGAGEHRMLPELLARDVGILLYDEEREAREALPDLDALRDARRDLDGLGIRITKAYPRARMRARGRRSFSIVEHLAIGRVSRHGP